MAGNTPICVCSPPGSVVSGGGAPWYGAANRRPRKLIVCGVRTRQSHRNSRRRFAVHLALGGTGMFVKRNSAETMRGRSTPGWLTVAMTVDQTLHCP